MTGAIYKETSPGTWVGWATLGEIPGGSPVCTSAPDFFEIAPASTPAPCIVRYPGSPGDAFLKAGFWLTHPGGQSEGLPYVRVDMHELTNGEPDPEKPWIELGYFDATTGSGCAERLVPVDTGMNNAVFNITVGAITCRFTIVGTDPETGLDLEMYQTTCMVDIYDATF